MVRITLRLPESLSDRLTKAARGRKTSLNQLIVTCLNEAVPEEEKDRQAGHDEELRRVKAALGAVEIDISTWKKRLGLAEVTPNREVLRESLPKLDPPLSRTVIEDREDRA